jgi:DNA-binding transcriptional regulator LsrR (DeoR family)
MARLNIYLPEDLAHDLKAYRGAINFSEVCAAALRAELSARTSMRMRAMTANPGMREPYSLAERICARYKLEDVIVVEERPGREPIHAVGRAVARLVDEQVFEGAQLAVGGGAQMWAAVRLFRRRNLRVAVSAIGFGNVDHANPHLHPNALVTQLSLLYAPRSSAVLVGAPNFVAAWSPTHSSEQSEAGFSARNSSIQRIIVGTCELFDAASPSARVLGAEITSLLEEEAVIGDFLGVFFKPDGAEVQPYPGGSTVSHISAADLREYSRRPDTIVVLAAAGKRHVPLLRRVLASGLCNTLITDQATASALV